MLGGLLRASGVVEFDPRIEETGVLYALLGFVVFALGLVLADVDDLKAKLLASSASEHVSCECAAV